MFTLDISRVVYTESNTNKATLLRVGLRYKMLFIVSFVILLAQKKCRYSIHNVTHSKSKVRLSKIEIELLKKLVFNKR